MALLHCSNTHHISTDAWHCIFSGIIGIKIAGLLLQEHKYFDSLQEEPEDKQMEDSYLEALQELQAHIAKLQDFCTFHNHIVMLWVQEHLNKLAVQYKNVLDTPCWMPDSVEWQETEHQALYCQYNQALNHLESLVVQCLFELEKFNLRGTSYAMQRSIAKAMDKRCKSIKMALEKYNMLTAALCPPQPQLSYQTVVSMTWVANFLLLCYSRNDVQHQKWVDKLICKMTVKWLYVQCTKAEIQHINVEVCGLWSALHNEPLASQEAISTEERQGATLLSAAMKQCLTEHLQVNELLKRCIQQIFSLLGFNGNTSVGVRVSNAASCNNASTAPAFPPLEDDNLDNDVINELSQVEQAFAHSQLE
ncbi:hypothetical protein DACRYDRAFT_90667 [Dacryopinax primogenitus]|uniref:Uncharacterized protein n=1 Tax=Dacryopinax primogenitus (strain DJM 731) TaxID=1858805 RepID=M5FZT3_DACPD|nr:uncharacterized protein DACRYDRAFT_90667 [Dacryopinax primogenitus]EJT99071.1 hypothetical protein DACRYDRAFT_90667 [Dacryopinax primogenitus]